MWAQVASLDCPRLLTPAAQQGRLCTTGALARLFSVRMGINFRHCLDQHVGQREVLGLGSWLEPLHLALAAAQQVMSWVGQAQFCGRQ